SDADVRTLGDLAVQIEAHYESPQDTEWAFDAEGRVWMLQSRPVTATGAAVGEPLVRGLGAAPGAGSGAVRLVATLGDADLLAEGDVLVTHMTAPDWVPLMRRAAAIVTDSGGMTCHAAIVSRELGIPCVVGTGDATRRLKDGFVVTVSGTDGVVYLGGKVEVHEKQVSSDDLNKKNAHIKTATKIYVNLAEPELAKKVSKLNVDGVGLLRAEFMIANIGMHP